MTKEELQTTLMDIQKRLGNWEKDWTFLFDRIADELMKEGEPLGPDYNNLRDRVLDRLNMVAQAGKASDAELSLLKLLTPYAGKEMPPMSLPYRFLDLLTQKVNAELELKQIYQKEQQDATTGQGLEKKAFHWKNETFHFELGKYAGGALAVKILDVNNSPYAVLSVNLPLQPSEGCFWLKDWSENEPLAKFLVEQGMVELTGTTFPTGYVRAKEARLTQKGLTASLDISAATYDSQETDELMTKELANRDDYGQKGVGESGNVYHDYPEDSNLIRPWSPSRHQQNLWNRFREWWWDTYNKTDKDKRKVGREQDLPEGTMGEGFWAYKQTPYVGVTQSPTTFMAMPAMKIGQKDSSGLTLDDLKCAFVEKMSQLEKQNAAEPTTHNISFTVQFTEDSIKIECTWAKGDNLDGLNEVETLSRIVSFLEGRLTHAIEALKQAKVEDVDVTNRTISIVVPRGK